MMDVSTYVKNYSMSVENFVVKQLELLDFEREAEIEENKILRESTSLKLLQKKGICLPKLHITRLSTGLFGRLVINFQSILSNSLSTHSITSGDIVGIGNTNSDGKIEVITSGVVFRVTDSTITVAFDKNSDSQNLDYEDQFLLIKLANDVTYKRLKKALKTLETKSRESNFIDVLFGQKQPSTLENSIFDAMVFYNKQLNSTQKEAIKFALSQKEVSILHGPPGTGKTTTLVECLLQAVSQKLKVLACAPSNVAVDNLVEKLVPFKVKMVRLGHPARLISSIQQYSLDAIVAQYDGSDVIADMRKDMDKLMNKIEKAKGFGMRKSLWADNKTLVKEIKDREKEIVKQILKNADVILSTLTSASDDGPLKYIEKDHFDICFIDECSQSLEAACWIPLQMARRCILAGDHNQLPPTIISKTAEKAGLGLTLMERLLKLHGNSIKKMLTVQYRMHEKIMHWSSKNFYDDKLLADDSVCHHLLKDLNNVQDNENTSIPLLLIDTAGCGFYELETEDEESKGNEGEADIVCAHVKSLISSGIQSSDIAIITPYNLQVELLKSRLFKMFPKLEIKSVDGFQGREKEAVVLSLVRSNKEGEVGFLADQRRINVAVTRAKRHLTVVCDSQTVSHNDFLKLFVKYCEENGEVRVAFEYEKEIGQYVSTVKKKNKTNSAKKPVEKKIVEPQNLPRNEENWGNKAKRENERLEVESKYQKIIDDFINSKKESLIFSTSLSAFERRTVHELAEKMNLIHISSGEGAERHIQVKKSSAENAPVKCVNLSVQEKLSDNKTLNENLNCNKDVNTNGGMKPKSEDDSPCLDIQSSSGEKCCQVKKANVKQPINSSKADVQNKTGESHSAKEKLKYKIVNDSGTKKTKPKLKTLKLKDSVDASEDNFDDLIQQAMKADNTCSFESCKKGVAILSQVCQHCRCRFCFSHFMPEVHGCGDAAKAYARSQIRKDGVLYPGSGRPQKKTDAIKHSYLQKKLDKKLTELSQQRKSKPKPKE
ncbi:DNA-binding protein SMUBP-2-like [Uloborus diversus]|uniref:DNA-binding protein SMUBP-2-like n=1 Tax=Uloborus diversus TaxID=327109 RepID=UPI00240950DC|nr:DNA-binding protein SMUBP-2-like [Uloborus diversus]